MKLDKSHIYQMRDYVPGLNWGQSSQTQHCTNTSLVLVALLIHKRVNDNTVNADKIRKKSLQKNKK